MNNPNWTLRAFAPGDEPALQNVRAAAFAPIFDGFRAAVGNEIFESALKDDEKEQAELLDTLCRESADKLFVAEVERQIIGFVSYSLDVSKSTGEIGLNAVHPDHAGQGIGAAMFEHVMDLMKKAGMKVATVSTGGDAAHAPARRAYDKVGFSKTIPAVYFYKTL